MLKKESYEKDDWEAKKTPEQWSQSPETEPSQIVHSGFDKPLIHKKSPIYKEPSTAIDDVGRWRVLNSSQPAWSRKIVTDEKLEHLTPFLRSFLIWKSLRAKIASLQNRSVLLPRDTVWVSRPTAAINEKDHAPDMASVGNKAL